LASGNISYNLIILAKLQTSTVIYIGIGDTDFGSHQTKKFSINFISTNQSNKEGFICGRKYLSEFGLA
jgi:hypothetical protein